MKIESIIKRDPPTEVVLGDTAYKFKPDAKGRHVCEVTDKAHIARLLSIAEGYQIPDDEDAPIDLTPTPAPVVTPVPAAATIQPTDDDELKGSTVHPAIIDINGETVELVDVVAEAHELSGMTTAEWNTMPEEARHLLIDAVLDAMAGGSDDDANKGEAGSTDQEAEKAAAEAAAAESAATAAKAERDELAAQWKTRTGSLPHYKWTSEKIREELAKPVDEGK